MDCHNVVPTTHALWHRLLQLERLLLQETQIPVYWGQLKQCDKSFLVIWMANVYNKFLIIVFSLPHPQLPIHQRSGSTDKGEGYHSLLCPSSCWKSWEASCVQADTMRQSCDGHRQLHAQGCKDQTEKREIGNSTCVQHAYHDTRKCTQTCMIW